MDDKQPEKEIPVELDEDKLDQVSGGATGLMVHVFPMDELANEQ